MIADILVRYLNETFDKELKEQPGAVFFPKGIIEPPLKGRKVPDGASLDYILLAAATAIETEDEKAEPRNSLGAMILRAIRRDILFCVLAERCLMVRIGGPR